MKKSQKQMILEYLQAGHTLTGLDGLRLFYTMNMRNRISELRQEGYNIQDRLIHNKETGKHYCEYWLTEEPARPEQEEIIANSNLGQETQINMKQVGQQMELNLA